MSPHFFPDSITGPFYQGHNLRIAKSTDIVFQKYFFFELADLCIQSNNANPLYPKQYSKHYLFEISRK